MLDQEREKLRAIKTFPSLVKYLRDELDWPIETDDFNEIVFDYDAEELGIDPETAVKIDEIKQLRPLVTNQPWGIFFIKFEPKKLPVVVLRRILSRLVFKKRASANKSEHASWNLDDLLFISNYGEDEQRQITFAHFSQDKERGDLPTLKVLGWDDADTALHLDYCHQELKGKLHWPDDEHNLKDWCEKWSSAFILRHREVITTSKDLASRLADLAKRIRSRANRVLAIETERGHLRKLYKSFQEGLIHDLSEDDFADMYAQTIAYGLLAARVSRPMGVTADNVADMIPITNPFLKDMLGTFLTAGGRKVAIDFDELGVQEVVELLNSPDTHMDAILRDFGNRTQQEDPVIHFYELFLSEYDKKKKVQRGIFYTPQPVVSYIVRSVHELLQNEFGLEDGLAAITNWGEMVKRNPDMTIPEGVSPDEPFVQILDPATGTATFLVEVIDIIHKTMRAKWIKQGHMALETQSLWNEYVPKHILPRLYGFELMMAPYAIAHMKLGLKLYETGYTFNADERVHVYLTNSLEPATDTIPQRVFEQWAPALAHEAKAVNEVKRNKRFTIVIGNPPYSFRSTNKSDFIMRLIDDYRKGLKEKKPQLNDDYVKFLRFCQYLFSTENFAILGMITNNSYLYGVTHSKMRESICSTFSEIYILDLGGDIKFQTQNSIDENVFDIQQGVCIGILIKIPKHSLQIRYSSLSGTRNHKYRALDTYSIGNTVFDSLPTTEPFYFTKSLISDGGEYNNWISITDIFPSYINGIVTSRDRFCVDENRNRLLLRLKDFASLDIDDLLEKYKEIDLRDNTSVGINTAQNNLASHPEIITNSITKCSFRPFDVKFIAYNRNFIHRTREEIMKYLLKDNIGIVFCRNIRGDTPRHFFVARHVVMKELISSKDNCYVAPLYIYYDQPKSLMKEVRRPNFGGEVISWLDKISAREAVNNNPELFFNYIYAILYSPNYRTRYSRLLERDFAHLPLVSSLEIFRELYQLGGDLVALHLMESPRLNTPITEWHGSTPSNEVEKVTYSDKTVWLDKEQTEGFRGVPENVWNFRIGSYQVCDKWLKDRKGRVLSVEDITHYQKIVVALNETIRLMNEIDEVIEEHGGWPGAFT